MTLLKSIFLYLYLDSTTFNAELQIKRIALGTLLLKPQTRKENLEEIGAGEESD
jgi:hypothetical protein